MKWYYALAVAGCLAAIVLGRLFTSLYWLIRSILDTREE